jgi:hypothetical protein
MRRYFAAGSPQCRPRADWDDLEAVRLDIQVYEPERLPVDTGLLDANGVRLWRVDDRPPIGFGR